MRRRAVGCAVVGACALAAVPAGAQVPLPLPTSPPQQPPSSSPAQPPPPPADNAPAAAPGPRTVQLSDERTHTVWAHASSTAVARLAPKAHARKVARLHYWTEDGFDEVYVALTQYTDRSGTTWVRVRLPMRPNGTVGWVRRSALGKFHTVSTFLLIDRGRLRATLFKKGKPVFRAPVGVGRPSLPTPAGDFWIRERLTVGAAGGLYGPLAFGTSAYSRLTDWPGGGVVGIHGTNEPGLIPGRPSHGCVRMRNGSILKLARLMPIGTPIRIV